MALATITIPGDGVTTLLPVNFALGVLAADTVTVRVGNETTDRPYTWNSYPTLIQVSGAPAAVGQNYVVRRRTPRTTRVVNWLAGAPITEANMDNAQLQALHLIHEALDAADGSGGGGSDLPPLTGNAGKVLAVNSTGTGLEWVTQSGGGGGGGIPDAPNNSVPYVRRNLAWAAATTYLTPINPASPSTTAWVRKANSWVDLTPEVQAIVGSIGVSIAAFGSRSAAEGATIPGSIPVIAVVHSNQALFYRRFTGSAQDQDNSALKSNGGTVFWNPAGDFSPLHWGAAGDGVTNDRLQVMTMFRFMFGTPTSNGNQVNAFMNQRPLVIHGHNRVYATAAPINLGNRGNGASAELNKTGMVYRLRIHELSLKAIAGDWDFDYDTNMPRALLHLAWNFGIDADDTLSGMYDVYLDHLRLDCNWLSGGVYLQNTYQTTFSNLRIQHLGIDKIGVDTSVGLKTANPDGLQTLNGALTFLQPNIEGRVGEVYPDFPAGRTIETMGTTAMRIRTNDFRIDGVIASGCTTALDLYGRAGQIYNMHPWSREVRIRPTAHNLMFCNSYLDYTKFIIESWGHKFIAMHWILPNSPTGTDRGVELRATAAATDGDGLMFTGCTFANDLDIRYTTEGVGTWVGDKARKVIIKDCWYGAGSTIAQIERFKNMHGITVSSGAHWFRTGDANIGEVRMVGDTLYVGKDRLVDGGASVQLQSKLGDQTTAGMYSYTGGGMGILNSFAGGFIELGVLNITPAAFFISGTTGAVNISRTLNIDNALSTAQNALTAQNGDIRAVLGGLAVFNRTTQALTDTTTGGWRFTGQNGVVCNASATAATSALLNMIRQEAGFLIRGSVGATTVNTQGLYINASGNFALTSSSDERLKMNFEVPDASIIDQFGVYSFEWKDRPGTKYIGVKAQELLRTIPEAVIGSEEEGYGVAYTELIPLMLATIKDLRKRVAELEERIK